MESPPLAELDGRAEANRPSSTYQLGHLEVELQRLITQAAVLDPITERLLRQAGIGSGMHVLDIGCGAGDVSMLAAGLVGPSGSVMGIDRSPDAIAMAQRRAQGRDNVTFAQTAADGYDGEKTFDMVIARYVLMHQADPVDFLRAAARLVKPGGVIAVHDITTEVPFVSQPSVRLWQQAGATIVRAVEFLVPNIVKVLRTPVYFKQAGLVNVSAFCDTPIGGAGSSQLCRWIADTCQVFATAAQARGLAMENTIAFDGLAGRIESEIAAAEAQVATCMQVCVWGVVA